MCQGESLFDLAIVDLNLPDGDGLDLMGYLKSVNPKIEVIILTALARLNRRSKQRSKVLFISFPNHLIWKNDLGLVEKALSHRQLLQENSQLRTELNRKYKFDQIIGRSPAIQSVLQLVERISDSDATVLISGESGTGKELFAKATHYNSPRSKNPFVAINCGAIPSELLESELFGHTPRPFPGSRRIRRAVAAGEGRGNAVPR